MKSKFLKGLAVFSLVISCLSLAGCNSNNTSNTDKQNANVKDESSKDDNSSSSENNAESNIILLENDKIAAVLSEIEKNIALEKAIKDKYDLDENTAKQTRYYYNYVDLNGDGTNEIFVEVVGPYTSGSGGDSAIIFKDNNGTLEEIEDFTLIRNPVIISDEKTDGWNNIIVESSGGGAEKKYVVLKYDGDGYSDVNESETIDGIKNVSGTAIISNNMAKDMEDGKGLYLG